MSSLTAIFAYFIKKSADHFVDYFVGHSVVLLGLSRSFLIFQRRASIVEITAIRENRIAPGIISESYFFGGDGMLSEFALPLDFTLLSACIFLNCRPE